MVEKCLVVFNNENRTEIIHELLSAPHFDQLLQDAHANYVIQKALRHSEVCSHISFAASYLSQVHKIFIVMSEHFGA